MNVQTFTPHLALLTVSAFGAAGWMLADDALAPTLQARLEAHLQEHRIAGGAIGVLDGEVYHAVVAGVANRETREPVTERSLFPLGSVTKAFTGMMLADVVNRGLAHLEDPVTKYLPPEVGRSARALNRVTLLDLATHSSGMTDSAPEEPAAQVYYDLPPGDSLIADWISWTPTPPKPGDPYLYSYSNKGFLTLAFAVAEAGRRGGYNPLFQDLFRTPLGLRDLQTRGTLGPALLATVVQGYGESDRPNPNVGHGVNGNLRDLEPLLRALLLRPGTPPALRDAIARSQRPTRSKLQNDTNRWAGMGWEVDTDPPYTISKNGATAGLHSLIRLRPQEDLGIAILLNGRPRGDESGNGMGALAEEIFDLVQAHRPQNLAFEKPTVNGGGRNPARANDGVKAPGNFWLGNEDGDWWLVDLLDVHPVGALFVLPLWTDESPQPYTVWTSLDAQDWTLWVDRGGVTHPPALAGDRLSPPPTVARFLRVQAAGAPLRLVEVEVAASADVEQASLNLADPRLELTAGGGVFSYTRLTGDRPVACRAWLSRDLEDWQPLESVLGDPEVRSQVPGVAERVGWALPGGEPGPLFLRVVADRTGGPARIW